MAQKLFVGGLSFSTSTETPLDAFAQDVSQMAPICRGDRGPAHHRARDTHGNLGPVRRGACAVRRRA